MGKLYDEKDKSQDLEVGAVVKWDQGQPVPVDLTPLEDAEENLELVTECFSEVSNRLKDVSGIETSLTQRKLASVEYFVTLECYTPILQNIADGLGVKLHVASLEDFQNTHSTKAAHSVALEGIGEFIKNIWKKLKELMSTFFKKVREFFRRLVNANMELDTYEKYLPEMISKIKSEKLKVTDGTPSITSKLPSLLAHEGMTSIDSDFLLGDGQRALESLVEVIQDKAKFGLKNIASVELVRFREALGRIVELDFSRHDVLASLDKQMDELHTSVRGIVGSITNVVYSAKDLPEDVFETLSGNITSGGLNGLTIYGLVDHKDAYSVLPKNFNVFIVNDPDNRVHAATTSTFTEGVDDRLNPIENVQNLARFYDFYKKFSKQVNIRELDTVIGDCERAIDDTIKLMQTRFSTIMEHVKQSKTGFMMKPQSYKGALLYYYTNINEAPIGRVKLALTNDPEVRSLLSDIGPDLDMVLGVMTNKNLINKFIDLLHKATEELGTHDEFMATMGLTNATPEDIAKLVGTLDEANKFILSFFKALQVLFRGLGGNLIATYTECRYELAKYLYQSARRYG